MFVLVLEFLCLVISVILLINLLLINERRKQGSLFFLMLIINIVSLIFDMISIHLNGSKEYSFILEICYVVTYVLIYVVPVLFIWYVTEIISEVTLVNKNIVRVFSVIIFITMILMLIATLNGYVFYIENGFYHRAQFYELSQIVPMIIIVLMIVVILKYSKKIGARTTIALVSYTVSPLLALLLQSIFIFDESILFITTTISLLIIYLSVASQEIIKAKEKEAELVEAKTQLVISQIRPHFIFNTLNSISYLCVEDPVLAERTVTLFAQYLRANLDFTSDKKKIPFESELGHINAYLEIEKLRFADRLNIEYDIECDEFVVPALSIQPIVENAVKHGICKKPEGGTLTISTKKTQKSYEIIIEDDGVGFDQKSYADDGRVHIGIENVRKRIEMISLGSLDIVSEVGKGTVVTIKIPASKENEIEFENASVIT